MLLFIIFNIETVPEMRQSGQARQKSLFSKKLTDYLCKHIGIVLQLLELSKKVRILSTLINKLRLIIGSHRLLKGSKISKKLYTKELKLWQNSCNIQCRRP